MAIKRYETNTRKSNNIDYRNNSYRGIDKTRNNLKLQLRATLKTNDMDGSFMSGAFNGLIRFLIIAILVICLIVFFITRFFYSNKEIKVDQKLQPERIELVIKDNKIDTLYVYKIK